MRQKRLFIAGIIIPFILIITIFILDFHHFYFSGNSVPPYPFSNMYTGTILFTGDTYGSIQLSGCERLGSLTRRVALTRKFPDSLYLDFGNVFSRNPFINKTYIPVYVTGFQRMQLLAVNLTKPDLNVLGKIGSNLFGNLFISANLSIKQPHPLNCIISKYRIIPFNLRNSNSVKRIYAGVTGVTQDERVMFSSNSSIPFRINPIVSSLTEVNEKLEPAHLKILLYNGTYYSLKRALHSLPFLFDLVIARASLPQLINTMRYIKNTPVVFCDEYGRSMGCVTVFFKDNQFKFSYDSLIIGMGAPEDKEMDEFISETEESHGGRT